MRCGSILHGAAICAAVILLAGCGGGKPGDAGGKTTLVMFHADSLMLPFSKLEQEFERAYPNIDLKRESTGSNLAARKITDMGRACDIIAVADYRVIENILTPKHASWSIRFATNEIVLAYGNSSKHAAEINAGNWYKVLLREGVNYGHSNPELDPCGYWTLLAWQLADLHYKDTPGGKKISEALAEHCPKKNIRSDLNELHPLLQGTVLDYAFMYRSVAKQHHLKYVELPPEINLGDPAHAETYKKASVVIKTRNGDITRTGSPIVFAITILDDAKNPEAAGKFLDMLFGPVGKQIMADHGQALLDPLLSRKGQTVPDAFKDRVRYEE